MNLEGGTTVFQGKLATLHMSRFEINVVETCWVPYPQARCTLMTSSFAVRSFSFSFNFKVGSQWGVMER